MQPIEVSPFSLFPSNVIIYNKYFLGEPRSAISCYITRFFLSTVVEMNPKLIIRDAIADTKENTQEREISLSSLSLPFYFTCLPSQVDLSLMAVG